MVARCVEFYCKRPTVWLANYIRMIRLYYSQKFEDDYKTLIVSSNRALNIITLKAKVLSPNSWYTHVAYAL